MNVASTERSASAYRNDIEFAEATSDIIEDPANVVGVDSCSEPPYDKPPYTNAAGDFSMVDSGTMFGIRGYDESITYARLHIDARFGLTAMSVVDDCELLGRIFHVSHVSSHGSGQQLTPGRVYDHAANLPYVNQETWGLASFRWRRMGERLYGVDVPSLWRRRGVPDAASRAVHARGERGAVQIAGIRANMQPDRPTIPTTIEVSLISNVTPVFADWGSSVESTESAINVETGFHMGIRMHAAIRCQSVAGSGEAPLGRASACGQKRRVRCGFVARR